MNPSARLDRQRQDEGRERHTKVVQVAITPLLVDADGLAVSNRLRRQADIAQEKYEFRRMIAAWLKKLTIV